MIDKLDKEKGELVKLSREKFALFITAAMSYVAALAWNEAFKSLFELGGPLYFVASWGIWLYPIFATIFAIIIIIIVSRTIYNVKAKEIKYEEVPA